MALPEIKQNATDARLAALTLPEGGWSTPARRAALERVQRMGMPWRRDEYWRFTRPEQLVQPAPPPAPALAGDDAMPFEEIEQLRIVFVDGVFDAEASDDLALEGVRIERLAETAAADIHWARDIYGTLEERGQSPVARPLAALNTAFATDGALIHVTATPSKPIGIIYRHESESSDPMLHHIVRVDSGAEVTVLENGAGGARFSSCTEIDIADGGKLHHVRAQGRDHDRSAATHVFAQLGTESVFKSFTMTLNGHLIRNETVVELTGRDALTHIAGACVGDGDFHHDDTVFITHSAPHCESRQVFKKVLRNGAVGVFQGKILVRPDAQKTDAYQLSQSLMLDHDSQFLAKPELEIHADDVACSHGCTSGAIDEVGLFYLRSRGVPEARAVDLLTLAFLAEAVEEIEDERLSADVVACLEGWLDRRR